MKASCLILLAALVAAPASAQEASVPSGIYLADVGHTNVLWSVSHFGLSNYIGRFNGISATLTLDTENPEKSSVVAEIDAASVDTNYPKTDEDFDAKVASDLLLNAKAHPTIAFRSKQVDLGKDNTGKITGDLTFNGVTKPVVLDVKMNGMMAEHPISKKPAIGFSATGSISRSQFGVTAFEGAIGDKVDLTIEIEFAPK